MRPLVLLCLVYNISLVVQGQTQATPGAGVEQPELTLPYTSFPSFQGTGLQQDPTRPPGGEQVPATKNPAAPPGAETVPSPQQPPGAQYVPKLKQPGTARQNPAENALIDELQKDPLMRLRTARPTPPVPAIARVGVQSDDVLSLSLNNAIRRALENNSDIEVARGNVRIAEGTLTSFEGVYDPVFDFTPQFVNSVTPTTSSIGGAAGSSATVSQNTDQLNSMVTKQFSTGGGQYQFFFNNLRQSTSSIFSRVNPYYSSSLGVTFTQPLWRNRSIDTYRHQIRVQRKKLDQTDSDFRLQTITIIDNVARAYWELSFALHAQQVAIDTLNLAREQFRTTEQGVAAGTAAPLGRAEVDTQIATQESALLAAEKTVTTDENTFKQLILRDPSAPEWHARILPVDEPVFDLTPIDLNEALVEARKNRPELRRLYLQEDISKLDLQFARNQTKPRLDIVSTVSTTGLAGNSVPASSIGGTQILPSELVNGQVPLITGDPNQSSSAFLLQQLNQLRANQGLQPVQVPLVSQTQVAPELVGGYGTTLGNLLNLGTHNVTAGVTLEFPLRNRAAEGNLAVAEATRDQLVASLHSEEQAVEMDVRNTVQALETARQTVITSRAAVHAAELQLAGELQLFQVGQSTTFLVFQRENTLATARNTELRAEADFNNALADLQRATGSSLTSNHVVVDPSGP